VLDRLERDGAVEIVADLSVPDELVATVQELLPDVALVESTDEVVTVSTCASIDEVAPVTRVVLLARAGAPYAALAAGARGALESEGALSDLSDVVHGIARGEAVLPVDWAARVLDEYDEIARDTTPTAFPLRLSATEREVLQRLANGASATAVAGLHEVPVRLVRLHAGIAVTKLARHHRDRRTLAADS
jgi:DNA-binding NarL/FixJ family response regulator